ncbi:hypothetical protein GTY85_24140 [Streptomyces sp. SID8377]|nr:hypothetical protein [Streptomyces sp. SID8377]
MAAPAQSRYAHLDPHEEERGKLIRAGPDRFQHAQGKGEWAVPETVQEAVPTWKRVLRFVLKEVAGIAAALVLPAWFLVALSSGCIVPGEVPETSQASFDPVVPISCMALGIVGVISLMLAYRMSTAKPPVRQQLSAALKAQGWLVLLTIAASVALYDPHRLYDC